MTKRNRLEFGAAFGAAVLSRFRGAYDFQPVDLLGNVFLHPETSLPQDLVVRAMMHAPYTLAPKMTAYFMAHLSMLTHFPLESLLSGALWALWILQGIMMFRLTLAVTASEAAAVLATLIIGTDMLLVLADGPCNIQGLRESLAMPPLLWGILGLVQKRRWQALCGIALSTYMHATPAMYVWPLMFFEDVWEAWREPQKRRAAWLRAAMIAAAAFPLLWRVAYSVRPNAVDPGFLRMLTTALVAEHLGGFGLSLADWVFMLEGVGLIILALRNRRGPAAALWWRFLVVTLAFMGYGLLAYRALTQDWPLLSFWTIAIPAQPWVSLCLAEIAGLLVVSAWCADQMTEGSEILPAVLLLLASSVYHDFVSRLICLGIFGCVWLGRRRAAVVIIVLAAALPFLYRFNPSWWLSAATSIGLHGGFLSLPAFQPAMGLALAAALLVGLLLRSWPSVLSPARFGVGVAVLLAAVAAAQRAGRPVDPSKAQLANMADWIRENTPPKSSLLISPIDLENTGDMGPWEFPSRTERAIFATTYGISLPMFGASAVAPMLERLKTLGMEFGNIRKWYDFSVEIKRMDAALSSERIESIARANHFTHLLLLASRPWPGTPLHKEGDLVLYSLRSAPPAKDQP